MRKLDWEAGEGVDGGGHPGVYIENQWGGDLGSLCVCGPSSHIKISHIVILLKVFLTTNPVLWNWMFACDLTQSPDMQIPRPGGSSGQRLPNTCNPSMRR